MGLNFSCNRRIVVSMVLSIVLIACQSSNGTTDSDESSVPRSVKKIVSKYCKAVDDIAKDSALRMAVMPFMSTHPVTGDPNDFGTYFSEVITNQLISQTKNIHLIERTRLDVITKENSLTLSGIINEADARKVGELLPIDYILTGTYTVLGSKLMINARLINAITGEISFSKSDQLDIPDDIKKMLPNIVIAQNKTSPPPSESNTSYAPTLNVCEKLKNELFEKADSADPANYNKVLIQEGMKVPFNRECGLVHLRIIDHFVKTHFNSIDYSSFLIRCSDTMKCDWDDPRGNAILRYFAADTLISPNEWKAGLNILSKVNYYSQIDYIIRFEETISAVQQERLTELFKAVATKKVGIHPVNSSAIFDDVIKIMNTSYKSSFRTQNDQSDDRSDMSRFLALTTIINIADPYLGDTASNVEATILRKHWEKCTDPAVKNMVFSELCKRIKLITVLRSDDLNWLGDIAKVLYENVFNDDASVITGKNNNFHLMSMLGESSSKLIQSAVNTDLKFFHLKDLIPLCLYAGIDVKGVPPLDTLRYWLAGEDQEKKNTACTYLMYMNKRAAPLESNIIRAIRKGIHTTPQPVLNQCLIAELGALKTNTPEVRELLVECLAKNDPGYINDSPILLAIAQCGPAIVPLVKKYYNEDKWNRLYETLQIMKLMGAGAKDLIPDVQAFAKTCDNPKYRLQAEDVIDEIRNKK